VLEHPTRLTFTMEHRSMPKADPGHSTNVPVLPPPSRRSLFGAGAAFLAAGVAAALPTASEGALIAPTGTIYSIGLRFRALSAELDRLDALTPWCPGQTGEQDALAGDRDAADEERSRAFEAALTTRARTPADALVQAIHAFDHAHCMEDNLPTSAVTPDYENPHFGRLEAAMMDSACAAAARQQLALVLGALASLVAFLEPLAGLRADAFGWEGEPRRRAAALAALSGEIRA
jgi:hypothetical protein